MLTVLQFLFKACAGHVAVGEVLSHGTECRTRVRSDGAVKSYAPANHQSLKI